MTQRAEVTYAVYSAENPASRPKMRNTPIRSCEPSVVRWRLMSSLARVIAVEKPMQYSVPCTSLSIVLGMATSGTPALSASIAASESPSSVDATTEAQIRTAMNGHLCRCGTYPRILTAIQKAAAVMAKGGK